MKFSFFQYPLVIAFIIFLVGCDNPATLTYTIIHPGDQPVKEIAEALETVLERHWNVDIVLINNGKLGAVANVDSVATGKVDFTIAENHTPYKEGVSSVLVFYPQILHLFYKAAQDPKDFSDLVLDKTIYVGNRGSSSYRFMVSLMDFFEVDLSQVIFSEDSTADCDVIVSFSDILSRPQLQKLEDYRIFSFDQVENQGSGSLAEAISLKYPQVKPYIIPAQTYGKIAPGPILTVSSSTVLMVRSDLRDVPVNDMIKTIFLEKKAFVGISPLIFNSLIEDFDRNALNFPLHEGSRMYLDRDEPEWYERYAELFGVTFSIIIAVTSGLISLSKWQKQKKKDRVDVFYKVIIDIRKQLPSIKTSNQGRSFIRQIKESQNQAFDLLIKEELEADESFRIFMDLSKETIQEVKARLKSLNHQ